MTRVLIFDVDGTLTRSGQPLDAEFADFLLNLWSEETLYLVSGSDEQKLRKQLSKKLLDCVNGLFACSGNEFKLAGETIYLMEHVFPDDLVSRCRQLIAQSSFEERCGKHVEHRDGMLNISVVGRNAGLAERERYSDHDAKVQERIQIITVINTEFPEYEACMGGQISINITPQGWNKARVYPELKKRHPGEIFHFYADGISKFGNDVPLVRALEGAGEGHQIHKVSDYEETWALLQKQFMPSSIAV